MIPDSKTVPASRLLIFALALLLPNLLFAAAPSWWTARNVLTASGTANDYAVVNQGQLKNIAASAIDELDASFPGGAGDDLHTKANQLRLTSTSTKDYSPANIGQLKVLAKPIYDRLLAGGYRGGSPGSLLQSGTYPWPQKGTNDYAMANIGQVKNLFSFDLTACTDDSGLPDWWRNLYGIQTSGTSLAPRGDGLTYLQAYQLRLDPNDFFNGQTPSINLVSGANQTGAQGSFAPLPLVVQIVGANGVPLAHAPVSFSVVGDTPQLATSSTATTLSGSLRLFTDNGGFISNAMQSVYYQFASTGGTVKVEAGTAAPVFFVEGSGAVGVPVFDQPLSGTATVSQAFSYDLSLHVAGSPTSFSSSGLPNGFSLDSSSGIITGTALQSGTYPAVATAVNASGTGQDIFNLCVLDVPLTAPVITSPLSVTVPISDYFNYPITATNGPLTSSTAFTSDGTLYGLRFEPTSSVVSGSFAQTGTYSFTIQATNLIGTTTGTVSVTVTPDLTRIGCSTVETTQFQSFTFSVPNYIGATGSSFIYTVTGLPSGLQMSTDGIISGIPTQAGNLYVTLQAVNSAGGFLRNLYIKVDPLVAPVLNLPKKIYLQKGKAYSYTIPTSSYPTSFSAVGLPDGIHLDSNTGSLCGTATTIETPVAQITASNSTGQTTRSLICIVTSTNLQFSGTMRFQSGVSPYPDYATYSAGIFSGNLDGAGWPSVGMYGGYQVNTLLGFDLSDLPPDSILSASGSKLQASGNSNNSNPINVNLLSGSGSSNFDWSAVTWHSVNAMTPCAITSCIGTPVNGVSNLNFQLTGSYTNHLSQIIPKPSSLFLLLSASNANHSYIDLFTDAASTPSVRPLLQLSYSTGAPPEFILPDNFDGTQGVYYEKLIAVLNTSSTSYSITGLPPGLAYTCGTGTLLIYGTPTGTNPTYTIHVSATNANGTGSRTFLMNLELPPTLTSSGTWTFVTGTQVSYQIAGSNNPTSFTASDYPSGLNFDSATGIISGVVSATGTYNMIVSCSNLAGSDSSSVSISVLPESAPVISSASQVSANIQVPFNYQITALPIPTFYSISGVLPPGLTFDSATGQIRGTPTDEAMVRAYYVNVSAINSLGVCAIPLEININPAPAPILQSFSAMGIKDKGFGITIPGENLHDIYITSGSLPDGLSISDGKINGCPTKEGVFCFSLNSSNLFGTTTQNGVITIKSSGRWFECCTSPWIAVENTYFYQYWYLYLINGPIDVCVNGCLDGLSFGPDDYGRYHLLGVPTTSGTFSFNVTVSDSSGTNTMPMQLVVLPIPVFTSSLLVSTTADQPFNYTLTGTGDITSFHATPLPSGWSFDASTATISGTPTLAGVFSIPISATNINGIRKDILTVLVQPNPSDEVAYFQGGISPNSAYQPIMAGIRNDSAKSASLLDSFQSDGAYSVGMVSTTGTSSEFRRVLLGFDLSSLPDDIQITSATLLLSPTNTATTGTLALAVQPASSPLVSTWLNWANHFSYLPTTLSSASIDLSTSGNVLFSSSATFTSAVQSAVNQQQPLNLVLVAPLAESGSSVAYFSFAKSSLTPIVNPELTITYRPGSPTIPPVIGGILVVDATANQPFNYQIVASHHPISYTATSLPSGLTFNADTGFINGTPTTAGQYLVPLTASNAIGNGSANLLIRVQSTGTSTSGYNPTNSSGTNSAVVLRLISGGGQSVPLGNSLSVVVQALDPFGNPLSGLTLTGSALSLSGLISASSGTTTGTQGQFTFTVIPQGSATSSNQFRIAEPASSAFLDFSESIQSDNSKVSAGGVLSPSIDNSAYVTEIGGITITSGSVSKANDDPTHPIIHWDVIKGSPDKFQIDRTYGNQPWTWTTVQTVSQTGGAYQCTDNSGLLANRDYKYRIIPIMNEEKGQPAIGDYFFGPVKSVSVNMIYNGSNGSTSQSFPNTDCSDQPLSLFYPEVGDKKYDASVKIEFYPSVKGVFYLDTLYAYGTPIGLTDCPYQPVSCYTPIFWPDSPTFVEELGPDPNPDSPPGTYVQGLLSPSFLHRTKVSLPTSQISIQLNSNDLPDYGYGLLKTGCPTLGASSISGAIVPGSIDYVINVGSSSDDKTCIGVGDGLGDIISLNSSNPAFKIKPFKVRDAITNLTTEINDFKDLVFWGSYHDDPFYVDPSTPPGTSTILTFTIANPDGTQSDYKVKLVYPDNRDYSVPIDESSGSRYRKIGLNGVPLPDGKPQHSAESDQEPEETYVDALTLGLRHSTTDIYIPIPGSELALSARRDYTSEVWGIRSGLRPQELPEKAFGVCWTTNLAPMVKFVASVQNDHPGEPDKAYVTDESGANHGFTITYDDFSTRYSGNGTGRHFFPMPTAKNQQETNLAELRLNETGDLVFTRKFGTTIQFEMTTTNQLTPDDRLAGSTTMQRVYYAHALSVTDRLGNEIDYTYDSPSNLVPSVISVKNHPDLKLSIQQSPNGLIKSIWDANGNQTQYGYSSIGYSGDEPKNAYASDIPILNSVTTADGNTTYYNYNRIGAATTSTIFQEADLKPHSSDSPNQYYYHCDLTGITDPLGHAYQISYVLDGSKMNYMNDVGGNYAGHVGYYTQSGLPRNVSTVALPNHSFANFYNKSNVWIAVGSSGTLEAQGKRTNTITDAAGVSSIYTFDNSKVIPVPQVRISYPSTTNFVDPKMIVYQRMTAQRAGAASETFEFDIQASMALSRATDFSGNTTTYAHTDHWDSPQATAYRGMLTAGTNTASSDYTYYADPTSQTDAMTPAHTKTFTYTPDTRLMQSVTDEAGRLTSYTFDRLGRRTAETIEFPAKTIVKSSSFEYSNSSFPGFMTRSVVHKLSNDPPWARDLITEFTPDSNGRVAVETVDPAGLHLSTQHSYDKNGNKLCTADPKGNATWFTYDSRNRLVTVTHADGTQKKIAYDNRGNKSSETDENGVDTLYEYDSLNRLTTQARDMDGNHTINPGDLVTRFTYNNVGSKLTQTDPNGNTTHFAYDDLQRLVTTTTAPVPEAPFGYTTTFSYGQNCGGSLFESSGFKPTQTVDPRGYVTTVTYDALYRPTTTVAQYQFSPAASATTTKEYDAVGNVIAVTDPLGKRTETDYDALNRPTVTRFAVVNNGQPNPSYGFTQNFYTSTGLKYQTLNENSVTSQTVYDAASRPVQTIADFGGLKATTQSYYDAAGNVVATINPVGAETDFGYDARNRKICQLLPPVHDATDSDLNSKVSPFISTSYDALGNVIAVTDARGNTTRTSFDPANRAVQVVAPAASVVKADGTIASLHPVSRTAFDLNGNVLETWRGGNTSDTISTSDTLVDPVKTAFNTYDALNHLTSTTDALGIKVANSYDPAGNRLSVTDGKLQTTFFAYDGLNRNLSITDPAGAATRFGYNAVDKTSRTDATGLVTEYGYDDRHRLSTVTYPDPRTVDNRQYAYDLVGNLRSVKLPGTSGVDFRNVFYTYDNINRQITEISCGATIYHYYDLAGNRLKTIFGYSSFRSGNSGRPGPPFGRTLISTYDALNRLSTLTESASPSITGSAVTRYGYDLNGNIYQLTQPNRDTTVKTYDALNRVTDIVTKTGGTIQFSDYTQTYDLPGNVAKVVETYNTGALNNRTVTNGYDLINRLTSESVVDTSGTVTTSYVFDNAHNRKSKTVTGGPNPGTTRYSCPNKLNQIQVYTDGVTTVNLAYDANGNLKTRTANGGQTDTYTYDAENRLIGLQKNIQGPGITNGFFQYAYDYRTRRVQRIEPNVYASSTTQLIFSGGQSIQEYSGTSNSPTVEYIRGSDYGGGIGGILYTLRSGTPSFNHYNNRGDVVAQTGLSGSTTYLAAYEAFGKRTQEFGSTQDRQKANTKDEDPTGLLNEGMRYRDLETGSFITRDPLGFVDGPNMYSYVNENPWSKFDPEGLAGYFFDGTDNDKVKKPKEATHIAALNDMYKGTAFYSPGVGNGNLAGSLFGAGASARINTMMSHLETQIANGDKNVDVFGFSRGAAEARGFVNQIAKKHPDVNVRFLGLFDSVAQVGAANGLGVSSHVGINMDIPSNVNFTAQAIAKNEHRGLFPLSSISNGNSTGMHFGLNDSSGSNFIEKGFAGAHADVGGGYSDGGNRNALQWMMGQASGHGVPLDWNRLPPTERSFFNASKLHNSEMSASGLGDLNPVGIGRAALGGRNVFSGNLKSSN